MKIAVFFPGMGYGTDKPLLYYCRNLLKAEEYDIVELSYAKEVDKKIVKNVRDGFSNGDNLQKSIISYVSEAVKISRNQLKNIDFSKYEEIIFVSKSIGAVVSTLMAANEKLDVVHIMFTPLIQAFQFDNPSMQGGMVFCGDCDTLVNERLVGDESARWGLDLEIAQGGNHSLETGDVVKDIYVLKTYMEKIKFFLYNKSRTVYDFSVQKIDGSIKSLSEYRNC